MTSWSLGIDFGASDTVAAVVEEGEPRTIDIESDGRGEMPSATFLTAAGEVLVGAAALDAAADAPERCEPTPKRTIGEGRIFLGDGLVEVAELAGAVLRRAYAEACRQQGERVPDELRVTFPPGWAETRRAALLEACERGGLSNVELMPEPVAAAVAIALRSTPPGRHVAVYDFGGAAFDAAILLRTASGFEIAGPPAGRDPLGGADVDQRIIGYLDNLLAAEHQEQWDALLHPTDADARRSAAALRSEVRRAKEQLSETTACQLRVPGIERDVQLTRRELDELIHDDVAATVAGLDTALGDAGVAPADLAGLYLVGGSSRIPLVSDMLWTRFKVMPVVPDDPKSVVASGAAMWTVALRTSVPSLVIEAPSQAPVTEEAVPAGGGVASAVAAADTTPAGVAAAAAAPAGAPVAPPAAAPRASAPAAEGPRVQPRLAMALSLAGGSDDERCVGALVLERAGTPPLTLRVTDEPARDTDVAALAEAARSGQAERTPGFHEQSCGPAPVAGHEDGIERRYSMVHQGQQVAMLEQYLVVDDRALVIRGPEEARSIVESIGLVDAPPTDGSSFHLRVEAAVPPGWSASERLELTPAGSGHPLTAERILLAGEEAATAWRHRALDELMHRPGARLALRSAVRLFGTVAGEIVTVTWRDGAASMITKLGLATTDTEAFSLTVTLPHTDQRRFAMLTERAFLYEGARRGFAAAARQPE